MNNAVNLGKTATDVITGFTGVITGVASYITGCDQYCLTGKASGDSSGQTMWVDAPRVELDPIVTPITFDADVNQGDCESHY